MELGTRTIPLSRGRVTIVDKADYEMLRHLSWHVTAKGYARHCERYLDTSRSVAMHRMIMLPESGQEVDHINGDRLDNRRCNLRLCSRAENGRNRRRQRSSSFRFKGARKDWRRGKWQAYIKDDGIQRHLGCFESETEAARAYDAAAMRLFGDFARTNF